MLLYYLLNNIVEIDSHSMFRLRADVVSNIVLTRGNSRRLFTYRYTHSFGYNSFFARAVRFWNSLSDYVVCSPNRYVFVTRLSDDMLCNFVCGRTLIRP